jgi:amino acid transporter
MVAICGFMNWEQNPVSPVTPYGAWGDAGFSGIAFADWVYYIGMGIALGMWMYSGYESMSTIAGEVENPQVIPKATLITVPLIMAVYILPTLAGLATLNMEKITVALGSNAPEIIAEKAAYWEVGINEVQPWMFWGSEVGTVGYADVVTTNWGPAFGLFFVVVAVLAQCSIYNTYIASGSRGFFSLAEDHLAPPILVKCDKKHGVPYIAVLSVGIVNIILCNFAFTAVVVVDVFLLISAYVMIFISAMILRKRIPEEELKFKIPGGYGLLCLICLVPCVVAFVAFFINGTDYFIGGMIGIISGPVLYVIWKRMYGGLAKKDPVNYPLNPKTKLAVGDTKRISFTFLLLAVFGFIGYPWLNWFEGDWGAEYYAEENAGVGFLADFDMMLNIILWGAVACAVVGVIFYIISAKVEPKKGAKVA